MFISRRVAEIATSAVTALLGLMVCYGALENGIGWDSSGPQSGYFPFYVGCLIILGSLAIAGKALVTHADNEEPFLDAARMRAVIRFFAPIVAFAAISAVLGLYIGIALYIFHAMYVSARLKLPASVVTAVAVAIINFVIFEKLFMVRLLKGPVLNYFGIY